MKLWNTLAYIHYPVLHSHEMSWLFLYLPLSFYWKWTSLHFNFYLFSLFFSDFHHHYFLLPFFDRLFSPFFKRPCFLWKQNSQELRLWISEISLYHGIFGTQFQSFPQPTFQLFTVIHRFLCISREDTCHFFHGFWIPDSQYPFIHKLWITMWKSPFALQVLLKYTLIK